MGLGRCGRAFRAWLWASCLLPSTLAAQPREATGLTAAALPGIERIHLPTAPAPAVAVAASGGYGFIESQGTVDGAHHRAAGALAVGASVVDFLAFGLRFDGRHDMHPDDGMGADSGTVGDPRLLVRAGGALGEQLQLGGELTLWLPGENAPSLAFDASSLDARLLLAFVPPSSPWTIGGTLGYRLDQSAQAAPRLDRLRAGDRLTLGLSDFDAVLLGAGVLHRRAALELLGEVGLDLLVGSGAPSLGQSPIRIALGARYHLGAALSLALSLALSPSARPTQEEDDRLVPIEPRVALQAGVRYRFGSAQVEPHGESETALPPALGDTSPSATRASIEGRLVDEDGTAVAGARVRLRSGELELEAESDGEGRFAFAEVPFGDAALAAERDGYASASWNAPVAERALTLPDQVLQRNASGQLRGLALSFNGRPVAAQIEVHALEREGEAPRELRAGDDGRFSVELPPGRYEVRVSARGFEPQQRKVEVAADGVMILNLDLRKAKR